MRGARRTCGEGVKWLKTFSRGTSRHHLEIWAWKETEFQNGNKRGCDVVGWIHLAGSLIFGNEPWGSTKGGKFVDQLNDYQLLKKHSDPLKQSNLLLILSNEFFLKVFPTEILYAYLLSPCPTHRSLLHFITEKNIK